MPKWLALIGICVIIGAVFWYLQWSALDTTPATVIAPPTNITVDTNETISTHTAEPTTNQNISVESEPAEVVPSRYVSPLDHPDDRITKKPFGIFITPSTSPVQPERFSGYHTAVDMEILPDEENADVMVRAFCQGPIVAARTVSGYGGVIIQRCDLDSQTVTALYGHININSVFPSVGDTMNPGDDLALLGKGYSTETDGERKHLHFALHKGSAIEYRGYVSGEPALDQWIDPEPYL